MPDLLQFISPEKLVQMGATDYIRSGKDAQPKYPENPHYMTGWNAQKDDLKRGKS